MTSGLLAGLMFGLMYGAIRWLTRGGSAPASMALCRGVVGTLVLVPMASSSFRSVFSRNASPVWLRSAAGGVALVLQFAALQYAATTFVRSVTDFSVVLSALLAAWIYRERLRRSAWLGIVVVSLAVIGLSVLSYSAGLVPIVLAFGSAVSTTVAFLALRRSATMFSPPIVVWCLSLGLTLVAGALVLADHDSLAGAVDWRTIVFVAAPGVLGQLLLTKSFSLLPTALGSSLGLSTLCFGLIVEWIAGTHMPSLTEGALVASIVIGIVFIHYGKLPKNATHSKSIVSTPS